MNSLLQNLQLPQETAQHKQAEEKNVLLLLRNKLKKINKEAALGYSDEFIDQKTETEENFLKAAEEESETIWNGFVEQLEKEGANQSFIQGMLKEAVDEVKNVTPATQPTTQMPSATEPRNDLPGTQPSEKAHSILGGIPNKYSGALGGGLFALLGANMLGLKGPMKWMLPVLGGAAGYKFFPHIMNLAKDRMGEGVNRMGSGSANIFRKIVQQD